MLKLKLVSMILITINLVACGVGSKGESASTQSSVEPTPEFAHPTGVSYYYFLCTSTSWALNESSRLRCEDSQCISMYVDYTVNADWMLKEGDSCKILKTQELDNWNGQSEVIGAYVEYPNAEPSTSMMTVPSVARLFGSKEFRVQYPTYGTFRMWLTRARSAFTIRGIEVAE